MRDLEIRGAGNILGAQQSGHIAAVGYELFCQLLEDAVKELKEKEPVERTDPFIELDVGARLDEDYIPDAKLKIEVYRKLSRAKSEEELVDFIAGIEDRFGAMPDEARLLVEIARLRILAAALRIREPPDVKTGAFCVKSFRGFLNCVESGPGAGRICGARTREGGNEGRQ